MKLTDLIVNKIGIDKMLHALVCWVAVSLGAPFGGWGMGIMFVTILTLSFVKEWKFDKVFDFYDLWWDVFGAMTAFLYFYITHLYV